MKKFAALLCLPVMLMTARAATVTFTQQTANNAATFTDGTAGAFNNGGTEMGMFANTSGNKQVAVWRNFRTDGNNGGVARSLQVGDQFSIQLFSSAAFGNMGFSLNASGTQGGSYNNRTNNARLFVQEDGTTGSWYVGNGGGNTSLNFNVSSTSRDYLFRVYVTSQSTADVELIANGVTNRTVNLNLLGTAGTNINAFSMYLQDDYNGSGNANIYWKQTTSVQNLGTVSLGLGNSTATNSGLITDGLAADNNATASPNQLIKIGTNTITLNNVNNSYSGGTLISAGKLVITNDGHLGATTGGVTITGGIDSVLTISSSLTLNASRTITIGSSGGKLDAGANTLTIAGPLVNNSGNNHLFILADGNTTITGNATGSGDIVKQGAGTLTLNGSANTFGTTAANIFIDKGVVQGSTSTAFGQTASGNGPITMGASGSVNNGDATLLLTSAGASVANAINSRYFTGFNASKTVGGNNSSGTVTYSGPVTLNDGIILTNVSGGTVAFSGVIQQGTATGGQAVNGTPGLTVAGAGTTVLSGNNTYGGVTAVSNGRLLIHGVNGPSSVTVASGATLGGNGKVSSASLSAGATLSPGASVGNLTVTNLTLAANSTNVFEFDVAGGTNDTVTVVNNLTNNGGLLVVNISGGTLSAGTYTILTYGGTKSGTFNTSVTVTGSAAGTVSVDESVAGVIRLIVKATTSTAVTSSQNPSAKGQSVSFTATVTSGSGTPTGSVQFKTNGVAFGSAVSLSGGSATSAATTLLPRGTNTVTAEYSGATTYFASTNSVAQVVTNTPPTAGTDSYGRANNLQFKIKIADLLTNDTDVDGDTVTFVGANLTSTNSVTVSTNATYIFYPSNAPNANDRLSYTISDGQGGTATGYINITINGGQTGQTNAAVTLSNDVATVTFFGVPGTAYQAQRATNVNFTGTIRTWSTNAPTGSAFGVFQVSDDFSDVGGPPAPSQSYYRLVVP